MANTCTRISGDGSSTGTVVMTVILLVGLPLLGAVTAGIPLVPYLQFPPAPHPIPVAPFSWSVFLAMALLIVTILLPLVVRVLSSQSAATGPVRSKKPWPWWGWIGLAWLTVVWILAWNRFSWFAPLQRYTFAPLWLGYIAIVNAWTWHRGGRSLIIERPQTLVLLLVASAVFWWYFEFLNRFVDNWTYTGLGNISTLQYLFFGSISFSTVLPAVVSTRDLLSSFPRLSTGLDHFAPVRLPRPCSIAAVILVLAGIGLANMATYPRWLYPLLWVAPLLLLSSIQAMRGERQIFAPLARGDWREIWVAALAALVCGFFWEMWNEFSLAHWVYHVSFVERFHVFEMPIIGYAGYLPFGVECIAIAALLGTGSYLDRD